MSDKKNIDRLFQEKFKDFEVTPSPTIWRHISKELLTNKKRRKTIPIWWKFAGVAAGLLLMFSIWNLVLNTTDDIPKQNVVNTESENPTQKQLNKKQSIPVDALGSEETISEEAAKDPTTNSILNLSNAKRNILVSDNTDNTQKSNTKKTLDKSLIKNTVHNAITNTNNSIEKPNNTAKEDVNAKNPVNSTLNGITATLNANVDNVRATEESPEKSDLSISQAIAENDELVPLKNKDAVNSKWRIAPTIAPVYFNTLGDGSSLHPQFNDNSKTGAVNMSFGISTSYAINSKLRVRAGIHKVSLGYSTNDILVYNNLRSASNSHLLKNIAFKREAKEISFISADEFSYAQVPNIISNNIKSAIDQKLGFIEIPLELQYSISNNKLGISVLGGFSALILSDNDIYAVEGGKRILIGSATNINNLSYTANLGFGLDYKISKKINLNFEPTFKYQLNTFNNTSGNFRPYFIGVYSGFSFKF